MSILCNFRELCFTHLADWSLMKLRSDKAISGLSASRLSMSRLALPLPIEAAYEGGGPPLGNPGLVTTSTLFC